MRIILYQEEELISESIELEHADKQSIGDFDLCLTSTAMKNMVLAQIQEDFEFVVGCHRYQLPRIMAEILSSRVCLSHSVDPSIAEYALETSDFNDQFRFLMPLGSGSTVRVTKGNLDPFLPFRREFGNSAFYVSLLEHFDSHFVGSQTPNLAWPGLFSGDLIGGISSKFSALIRCQSWMQFQFQFFYTFCLIICRLFQAKMLFFPTSARVFVQMHKYFDLLQFVRFEHLSTQCICSFLLALPNSIDHRLWESISRRFSA
jgi:hypothetical protein